MNTTIEFCIFELVYLPNFSLKWEFCFFFDQICTKRVFPVENRKIVIVRASMIVTYYIKLFHTGADRHNGILMSLLLFAETKIPALWEIVILGYKCFYFTTNQQPSFNMRDFLYGSISSHHEMWGKIVLEKYKKFLQSECFCLFFGLCKFPPEL